MGWTETARREHDRSGLRYASDCTDEEWLLSGRYWGGAPGWDARASTRREPCGTRCSNIATTVCQWAQLPKDFPPFTTVQYYFYRMRDNGLVDVINAVLLTRVRVSEVRTPAPTAGIIDSQSGRPPRRLGLKDTTLARR